MTDKTCPICFNNNIIISIDIPFFRHLDFTTITKNIKFGNYDKLNEFGLIPENTLVEDKDIQLLSQMKIEQSRKKRLLESQLNELKKQSSNLQNVINLNKELNENPN